jgi:quercetin 2,3-dioxygenase
VVEVRASAKRGHFDFGWLKTWHTFSFGEYHDPQHMGFGTLRVINQDIVAAGQGFGMHPHRDMEIVTYVLRGALEHRDSMGNGEVLRPGEVQVMSAGSGIRHSEFNASKMESVELLQIWIHPKDRGLQPSYQQRAFAASPGLRVLVSPDGRDGSLTIRQDATVHRLLLGAGETARLEIGMGRSAWVQVVRGPLKVNGVSLEGGDGAAARDERALEMTAEREAEALVFDLG